MYNRIQIESGMIECHIWTTMVIYVHYSNSKFNEHAIPQGPIYYKHEVTLISNLI